MEVSTIGTAAFVISERHNKEEFITDDQAEVIANNLVEYLRFLIEEKQLDKVLVISGMEWVRGCITIIITFSIIGAVAGGYVVIDAIKDYKEVKAGLLQILEDIKNAGVWIKRKFRLQKQTRDTSQLPIPAEENRKTNNEPFKVMFEQAINNYESAPPEYRKYWAAGQNMTIANEKGELIRYTLALKREDILKPKELKKLSKKIKSKR